MPRIPTYDTPAVQQQATPFQPARAALSPEIGASFGAETVRQGDAIQAAGRENLALLTQQAAEANEIRVKDARNKARELEFSLRYSREAGYTNVTGKDVFDRQSGKPLADEYTEKFKQGLADIRASLGNDAQRLAFEEYSGGAQTDFHGQAMAHENQEFKNYSLSVHKGTLENSVNDLSLNWADPVLAQRNIVDIKDSAYSAARLQGKSEQEAEADARSAASKGHYVAIQNAVESGNPAYADDYLKRFSGMMDANDILRAHGVTIKALNAQVASTTADSVLREALPGLSTPESDRAFNIAVEAESGGRQFDSSGQPLTSKAGAIGLAQMMTTTGADAAKMAGVEWDENRLKTDPEYNRKLGKAYFEQQLRDFRGSPAMAYAAYNAGPGRLKEAIKEAEDEGKPDAWLSRLPAETQAYVSENMQKFLSGRGLNKRPTLFELQAKVRERVGDSDPERLKLALDETARRFKDAEAAVKQQGEEITAEAMRQVLASGGRYADLSPTLRARLPVEHVAKVMDFASKVSKGEDSSDLAVYNQLATDPLLLNGMTDEQFLMLRGKLSEADFKHFSNERGKASGAGNTGAGSLDSGTVRSVLDDRLRMAGLDPTPPDKDKEEVARVGAIRKFVNDAILAKQQETGVKFSDADIVKTIDGLFIRSGETDTKVLGFGSKTIPLLSMRAKDVPADEASRIKEAIKQRTGNEAPTDADVLTQFWRMQFRTQRKAAPNG